MQLQAGWGKIGIGGSMVAALLLAGCDTASQEDEGADAEAVAEYALDNTSPNASVVADNPCLSPWVIQGMKDNIMERAGELITNRQGFDERYQALLDSATIEFGFISSPNESVDDTVRCSAQADVTYFGNAGTSDAIVTKAARIIHNRNSLYSFMNMGITAYNIDEFRKMSGNTFSVNVDYEIGSTYSENGEENKSYNAQIGSAATMLASIAAFDQYTQDQAEEKAQAPAKLKAMKERIAIEDARVRAENASTLSMLDVELDDSDVSSAIDVSTPTQDDVEDDMIVIEDPAY